jgi:plasmid replication initiation protein
MKNDLIIKSNTLVEACFNLSLTEYRILHIAFTELAEYESDKGLFHTREFRVYAKDYSKLFNIDESDSYKVLRDASERLFNRYFTYDRVYQRPDFIECVKSRWVQKISYADTQGYIKFQLADDVFTMIGQLKDCFTRYRLSKTAQLTSVYAIRFYEMMIQWQSTKVVPIIELNTLRERLAIEEHEYPRVYDFKNRVLDPAIEQINKYTDITVSYEQHKQGRIITGFSFKFKQKKDDKPKNNTKRDPNTPDFFIKMTDAQRHLFANKMSEMPEMSKYSQGTESYQQFAIRIADMLLEPEKFRELYPVLEKAGFQL